LPRELADFVVLHEISHLREFNHSRRFRYTLATLCPDFKEKEATLKRYAYD
jgi:predicted metal-dependent hydrolase